MIQNKLINLPDNCGVYLFKNKFNDIIYVGKAISIKKRIKGHFSSKSTNLKQHFLIKNIYDIDYILTNNEIEAFLLESNLIKKYSPKFNVRLKDDKRYPYITITLNEKYPRLIITRTPSYDNISFGPFLNGSEPKKIIYLAQKIFKLHKCINPVKNAKKRQCLNYDIGLCEGICINNINETEYKNKIKDVINFLKGNVNDILNKYKTKMYIHSQNLEFEKAGECRDIINALNSLNLKQFAEKSADLNYDIIALSSDKNTFSILKLLVRDGKVFGKEDFSDTVSEYFSSEDIIEEYLKKEYIFNDYIPKEIILNIEIYNKEIFENWLSSKTNYKVKITIPNKGAKKKFLDLAVKNANNLLKLEQQRFIDKNKIIFDLKNKLELTKFPYYIETFDISNFSGKENVASMVVCKNGQMIKKLYRKYKIKTVSGADDFKSMYEAIYRRYRRLIKEKKVLPDLIIVDGGKGQVNSALQALNKLNIYDIDLIGIAKKEELIFKPYKTDYYKIDKKSDLLKFIQIIRNEAHRFAVSYHKNIRDKQLTFSRLDTVKGIGKRKKLLLLNHFGSVEKLKYATINDLIKIKGINTALAKKIINNLQKAHYLGHSRLD